LLVYSSSKARLNILTVQYSKSAAGDARKRRSTRGYTPTDLDQHRETQTVEQGAEAIDRFATIGEDDSTGTFQDAIGLVDW
jgi:hypothetical protein